MQMILAKTKKESSKNGFRSIVKRLNHQSKGVTHQSCDEGELIFLVSHLQQLMQGKFDYRSYSFQGYLFISDKCRKDSELTVFGAQLPKNLGVVGSIPALLFSIGKQGSLTPYPKLSFLEKCSRLALVIPFRGQEL